MRKQEGALAIALATVACCLPCRSEAQVHWDAGAQGGISDRFATRFAPSHSVGPSAEVHGHVAVYPMLRIGPYVSFEDSPTNHLSDRQIYAGGVRFKVTPPWLDAPWHAWGFVGVGYAYARMPAFSLSSSTVELPVGLGVARKITGPWELCGELAVRFDFAGLSWNAPQPGPPGVDTSGSSLAGGDLLAVLLSVGVSFQP